MKLRTDHDILSFLFDIKQNIQSPSVAYNDVRRTVQYSSCVRLHDGKNALSIYMINRCPAEFNNAIIKEKCEGNAYPFDTPVTNRWNLYEIFSSIFCAMCHNIPRRDMVVWNSTLLCPEPTNEPVNMIFITSRSGPFLGCRTQVEYHTASKLRRCNEEEPAATCNTNSTGYLGLNDSLSFSDVSLLCHSYVTAVGVEGHGVHRNPHCLTCSENRTFIEDELRCYVHYPHPFLAGWKTIELRKNISPPDMFFTFNSQLGSIIPDYILCYENQTRNDILNTCEDKVCSNSTLIGNKCLYVQNVQNSLHTQKFFLKLQFKTTEEASDLARMVQDVTSSMGMAVTETGDKHGFNLNSRNLRIVFAALTPMKTNMNNSVYKTDFEVDMDFMLSDVIRLLQISLLQYRHTNTTDVMFDKMVVSNTHDMDTTECSAGQKTVFTNVSVVESGGKMYAMFEESSMLVDLEQGVFSLLLTQHYGILHLKEFILCLSDAENTNLSLSTKSGFVSCDTVAFTKSEYKLTNHGQLKLNMNGRAIPNACLGYTLWYCWRLCHRYDSLKGRLCCRCQNDVLLTLLLLLLSSCGVSAEYTRIAALGQMYYTMHIVMAFFLVNTLVLSKMITHPFPLSTGHEAANFDAVPSVRTSPDHTHAQVFTIPTTDKTGNPLTVQANITQE
ncbi:uncharacterized protein LOC124256144 [Haliotis rubra]|uniref:uncharacterized protein LOC124256144 n=1 Tax=Haliotis rubra TaxID=36100 RepID=UPI001EE5FB14|nr:uncharacterized protein LOC124256144 [Haliotis rubra]